MKTITSVLPFILICSILNGQELKTKKQVYNLSTEIFQVQKKTKKREGSYFEFLNANNDTLIKGQYHNNEKTGTWTFYDSGSQPFLVYNYSNDSCLWVDPLICRKDSFPVWDGNGFKFKLLDRPPLYLGHRQEFKIHLRKDYRIQPDVLKSRRKQNYTLSFIVTKTGTIDSLTFKRGRDWQISDLIMETSHNWVPGLKDGKPVDTKFYVIYNIGPGEELVDLPDSPFLFRANIGYWSFAVLRKVEIRRVGGPFPSGF